MKVNHEGKKIGRLTVLEYVNLGITNAGKTKWMWKCMCDCGNITYLRTYEITKGDRKSCGCYMRDFNSVNNTLPNNEGPKRELMRQYKRSAEKRGIEFNISEQQFFDLLDQKCYYCGLEPQNSNSSKHIRGFKYNGIDRINNSIGYLDSNCVSCCHKCNDSKKDYVLDDWLQWVNRLYNFQVNKGTFNDYPEKEYTQVSGNGEDPK